MQENECKCTWNESGGLLVLSRSRRVVGEKQVEASQAGPERFKAEKSKEDTQREREKRSNPPTVQSGIKMELFVAFLSFFPCFFCRRKNLKLFFVGVFFLFRHSSPHVLLGGLPVGRCPQFTTYIALPLPEKTSLKLQGIASIIKCGLCVVVYFLDRSDFNLISRILVYIDSDEVSIAETA